MPESNAERTFDVAIVGAGAAGLMAAIWAGRTFPDRRIIVLDGARKLGAKILVAGGGRCNVTHDAIDVAAYAGSSRNAIKKVLRRFDVPQTIAFFESIGVTLKREETGKLFPTTDNAHTVLDALLRAVDLPNVSVCYPYRIQSIAKYEAGFRLSGAESGQVLKTARVVLATGGRSLPKSGSDGGGYALAESLGHTITARVFPALVPLTLPTDHFICALSGLTVPATFDLRSSSGKKLVSFTDSTLCTHFGLSGPAALNISRYYTDALHDDPAAHLTINWLPDDTPESIESELISASPLKALARRLPDRLLRALCTQVGVAPHSIATRDQRKTLVQMITRLALPITGDRGYTYAEVTAGGVPLTDIRLETMESRLCEGLFLCGELCDVDGRIGGYNFQWAWASGYVAGISIGLQNNVLM